MIRIYCCHDKFFRSNNAPHMTYYYYRMFIFNIIIYCSKHGIKNYSWSWESLQWSGSHKRRHVLRWFFPPNDTCFRVKYWCVGKHRQITQQFNMDIDKLRIHQLLLLQFMLFFLKNLTDTSLRCSYLRYEVLSIFWDPCIMPAYYSHSIQMKFFLARVWTDAVR